MKTVVIGDLHLGTENAQDTHIVVPWFRSVLASAPKRIVFAGDTFELILPIDQPQLGGLDHEAVLRETLRVWKAFFDQMRALGVQEVVFVLGEHDWDLQHLELQQILKEHLLPIRVRVVDHWYDDTSETLVIHGSELDYNRIFLKDGKKVSCIDGLTIAINNYLTQTPDIERRIRSAAQKSQVSYWYSFGRLSDYIHVIEKIFGAKAYVYAEECCRFLRSSAVNDWAKVHTGYTVRFGAMLVRLAARFPSIILYLYKPAFTVMDLLTRYRIWSILRRRSYKDQPEFCKQSSLRHFIVGHLHTFQKRKAGDATFVSLGSPRLHTKRIQAGTLELFRDLDHVLIDGANVKSFHRQIALKVPLTAFK